MATRQPEESYFSYSASARGDGLRRPPSQDDSVDELLFVFSACNTPVIGSTPDNRNTYGSPNTIATERSRWSPAGKTERTSTTFTKAQPDQARSDDAGCFNTTSTHEGSREEFERKAGSRRPRREPRISTGATVDFIHSPSTSPETRAGKGLPTAAPPIRTEDSDVRGKPRGGPERRAVLPWRTRTGPVVDAYNPTGIPGSAATLGKYYPSNYEAGSDAAESPLQSPEAAASEPAALPPGSAQEHQLMQYKRDMISQTLQTAREALERTIQRQASVKAVDRDRVLDEGSRKHIASGVALLRRYKPSSPRITPLLSPGPVTPMALDESEERDYLSVKDVRPR